MFRTTEEEIRELVRELRELKEVLREISGKVAQVEARAKRAFPAAFPKTEPGQRSRGPNLTDPPTISSQEALRLYDDLVATAKRGQKEGAQRRLESMGLPDLFLLSRELGVSLGKSKPSRKALLSGVLGRINESVMLSASSLRADRPRNNEQGTREEDDASRSASPDAPRTDDAG